MVLNFESDLVTRLPSWYHMERAVLHNNPTNWEDACKEAGLQWEVETEPVFTRNGPDQFNPMHTLAEDWQAIVRDDYIDADPGRILAIQKKTYHVITNSTFGEVIDTALGLNEDYLTDDDGELTEGVSIEALMSLYGGRQIVAVCSFDEPLTVPWDPSKNYCYIAFVSRHDGNGGLRILPTNVRIACANAISHAEAMDGRTSGITIRHTVNWQERLAEVNRGLILARDESKKWLKFAEKLAMWKVNEDKREAYLEMYLQVSDDMGGRQIDNIMDSRDKIRKILSSETCSNISDNGYGLLMASTEWSDHERGHSSVDSYIARQLLRKEEPKARASRILRHMANA